MYGNFQFLPPWRLTWLLSAPVAVIDLTTVATDDTVIGRTDDGIEVTLNRFDVLGITLLIPQSDTDPMHEQLIVTIGGVDYRCTPCVSGGHYHIRHRR